MRIEVQRQDLTRLLNGITRVVETSNAVPVLRNVVLSSSGGTLTARGTNLDIEITTSCPCSEGDLTACVPAHKMADIVKRMAGDVVTMEFVPGVAEDTGDLVVKSGRSRFNVPSIPSKWFPTLAEKEYDNTFTADLSLLFQPVMSSVMADNDAKRYLCGVYLHTIDGKLRAVGADGPRMAIYDTDAPDGAVGMPGVIVSTKVAALAIAFKAPIDVSVCATRIRLVAPGTEICAKLIEGTYPDYARVVPQANNRMLRVDKAELASAVGRVGVVASESAGKPIRLNIAPGSIHLVAKDSDGREAVDEVAIEFDGEPTFVAYNTKFLDDMLAAVPGDTVEFDITDNTTTTRVRSVSDAAFVGVLTPFRMAA